MRAWAARGGVSVHVMPPLLPLGPRSAKHRTADSGSFEHQRFVLNRLIPVSKLTGNAGVKSVIAP
jgi:hypothetical protein